MVGGIGHPYQPTRTTLSNVLPYMNKMFPVQTSCSVTSDVTCLVRKEMTHQISDKSTRLWTSLAYWKNNGYAVKSTDIEQRRSTASLCVSLSPLMKKNYI